MHAGGKVKFVGMTHTSDENHLNFVLHEQFLQTSRSLHFCALPSPLSRILLIAILSRQPAASVLTYMLSLNIFNSGR